MAEGWQWHQPIRQLLLSESMIFQQEYSSFLYQNCMGWFMKLGKALYSSFRRLLIFNMKEIHHESSYKGPEFQFSSWWLHVGSSWRWNISDLQQLQLETGSEAPSSLLCVHCPVPSCNLLCGGHCWIWQGHQDLEERKWELYCHSGNVKCEG